MWKQDTSTLLVDVYADEIEWFFVDEATGEMDDGSFADPKIWPSGLKRHLPCRVKLAAS